MGNGMVIGNRIYGNSYNRNEEGEQGIGMGTGNGERGMGNGERGTGNGERGTGNGERGTGNGERGTWNGERGLMGIAIIATRNGNRE